MLDSCKNFNGCARKFQTTKDQCLGSLRPCVSKCDKGDAQRSKQGTREETRGTGNAGEDFHSLRSMTYEVVQVVRTGLRPS